MKHVKRTLILLIAAFMALSPLLSIPVQAATYWIEEISKNYRYEGAPNSTVFAGAAAYNFKVVFVNSVPTLVQTSPTEGIDTSKTITSARFTSATESTGSAYVVFGGITVYKTGTGRDSWIDGDTFSVVIANVGDMTDGIILKRSVKNTSGNLISRITRNTVAQFEFTVIDPTKPTGTNVRNVYVQVDGGSFLQDDPNITIEKTTATYQGEKYLAFQITMPRMRYTGDGNVLNFSVYYRTDLTTPAERLYFSTEWSECVESNESIEDDYTEEGEKLDPITPYIIVESFNYGGTSVTGGDDFELELVLRNTSTQYTLQNVIMSVNPTGVYNLTSSSNTYYLKSIFAGASVVRTLNLRADLTTASTTSGEPMANAVEIKFTFQYVANDARVSGTSNETITIPVTFPDRLELTTGDIPTNMYVGDAYSIYIPVVNKGRTAAYNVEATILGDVDVPGRTMYVGNVKEGDEASIDFEISFSDIGRKSCEVVVTYEDANMNRLSKNIVFAVEVEEYPWYDPGIIDPGPELPTDTIPRFQLPRAAYIAGIATCALSAFLTIMRAKARRREFLDESI